jgi:hypothetical protein
LARAPSYGRCADVDGIGGVRPARADPARHVFRRHVVEQREEPRLVAGPELDDVGRVGHFAPQRMMITLPDDGATVTGVSSVIDVVVDVLIFAALHFHRRLRSRLVDDQAERAP